MAKLLKLRRGSTSQHSSFTGAEGEVTIDTTKDTAVVHDGTTQAGRPLAREDMNNVSSASIAGRLGTDSIATSKIAGGALPTDVTVTNANVVSNAAIAGTKISPNFGSQDITGSKLTINSTTPIIEFPESDGNPDYRLLAEGGIFILQDHTNTANKLTVASSAIAAKVNLAAESGLAVTGNITVTGTVDGRDVAADGAKLNGIEAGATADQTAAEIRTLVESASDSNVFTDADHSKLNGIAAGATNVTNNNQLTNGAGYVTSSGNTIIGTDSDIDTSGATVIDQLNMTDGVITSHSTRTLTLANLGYTGATNANNITNNNQLTNGAGYTTYTSNQATNTNSNVNFGTIGCTSLTASGNVTAFSDSRLKTEIHTIKNPLEKVDRLRGVTFKWLHTDKPSSGVIAQEVQEVFPELVECTTHEGKEVLSVDYGKLVGVLIESIKELKAEFEAHKAECAKQHGGE